MKPVHFQKSQLGILLAFLLMVLASAWAQNPVPSISTPLFPQSLAPGGPSFVLTVDGSGFVSGSVVEWNGSALLTTFVSSDRLKANVPSANIASPGTAGITVSNGGVTSNVGYFDITNAATVSFNQTLYAVGNLAELVAVEAVAVGDFNGDGRLDLAVVNGSDNTVSILLGNGEGTFQPAVSYPVGNFPVALAVGDFNGDGKLDLAVANLNDNTVSVLLGNGSGSFTAASGSPITVGRLPESIAVGDFNGDGTLDLAVANGNDGTVGILLGNGAGSFTAASGSPITVGGFPESVAVGDFNGDGNPDLAVANYYGTVTVLLGNGSGSFTAASGSPFAVGLYPAFIAAGDLNGDGSLDLAVANFGGGTVSVLLGNGNGSFSAAVNYSVGLGIGAGSAEVAVGDFNGDGILDLAVTNERENTLSVLMGKGDGTFLPQTTFPTENTPRGVAVGDFNGDGRMDLAVANLQASDVSILLQPTPAPPPGGGDTSEILSLAAGTGLISTGGENPTISLNTSFTDGRYLQLTGGTLSGSLFAPSFSGSGANLTNLNPASLLSGTAGINITGNAATATIAASSENAIALGGVGPGGYAPSSGSSSYVQNNTGPAQTASLNISGNAGIGGSANVAGNLSINGPLTIGGTGTPIKEHISIQVNPSFPALKGGTCASANFALSGAADGDTIALGVPNERMSANATVIYTAWVSAANTVTVQACDILGAQKTAGTGSIRVDLWKH